MIRFKTKEEFLNQYGSGWDDIHPGWSPNMDNFFGKPLNAYLSELELDEAVRILSKPESIHKIEGWAIKAWMIKGLDLKSFITNFSEDWGLSLEDLAVQVLSLIREKGE